MRIELVRQRQGRGKGRMVGQKMRSSVACCRMEENRFLYRTACRVV